ncbi:MAG: IPT/TIG domain-containing protein [Terriglobia bacterium]
MRECARSAKINIRNARAWIGLVSVITLVGLTSGCDQNPSTPSPASQTINVIQPKSGPASGGTLVDIFGGIYMSGVTVSFGGTPSPTVSLLGSTHITAVTPAHAAGTVDVVVTNLTSVTTITGGFVYNPLPTITSVSPNVGSINGGTSVTITGTGFAAGANVTIGGLEPSNIIVISGTKITATTPGHPAGPAAVTVTNPDGGTVTLQSGFTYGLPPSITSVAPTLVASTGGTVVIITGSQFQPGATVTFGGVPATGIVVSANGTSIQATAPAGTAGTTANITVTNPDGGTATLPSGLTYLLFPIITSVSPASGTSAGGTSVTISGANFQLGATVTFGGVAATGVVVSSGTSIQATTPAGAAGAVVNVTVTNPDSGSATLASAYTYLSATHAVDLAWVPDATQPAGVTVTGYNIYRQASACTGTGTTGKTIIASPAGASTTTYTDAAVVSGQTYCYVVTALAGSVESATASPEAQAIVP